MFIWKARKVVFYPIKMVYAFVADLLYAKHLIPCAQLLQHLFIAFYTMQPFIRLLKFWYGNIRGKEDPHTLEDIEICKCELDLFQG